jgi:predicted ester cyclase
LSESDRNKITARRLYDEVITGKRLELIDEIVAEDSLDNASPAGGVRGRDGFRQHIRWLIDATEDLTATVDDLVAEDDRVVVYWTIDAIQRAEIFGAPPSGRRFHGQSISLISFKDDQITDYSVLPDRLTIVQQLTGAA